MLQVMYFEDLIKLFYSNLKITGVGNLCTEVREKKIKITPPDWLTFAHLKYQGQKLTSSNFPEELNYDHDKALTSMIRLQMHDQNIRNGRSLNINDRLFHYIFVHILSLGANNFAQLLH